MSDAKLDNADLRGANFTNVHQRGIKLPGAMIGLIPGLALETRGLRQGA
jgi:uncharacterized protein YjbI with pentapeptide repeats